MQSARNRHGYAHGAAWPVHGETLLLESPDHRLADHAPIGQPADLGRPKARSGLRIHPVAGRHLHADWVALPGQRHPCPYLPTIPATTTCSTSKVNGRSSCRPFQHPVHLQLLPQPPEPQRGPDMPAPLCSRLPLGTGVLDLDTPAEAL